MLRSIIPLPEGTIGKVLVCRECRRGAVAHYYTIQTQIATCMSCGAGQHLCLGQCGAWVPVEHALCDRCEIQERSR